MLIMAFFGEIMKIVKKIKKLLHFQNLYGKIPLLIILATARNIKKGSEKWKFSKSYFL